MKRKFSLWLNIVTICLCVCAIAIGVYAATSATLTVSGQIGFKAHDCEVEVSMTKMGYSTGDGTTYQQTPLAVTMDSDTTPLVGKVAGNGGEGTISSVNLGELNFTDLAAETIPNIVLTMTITNKSAYKVAATVTVKDADNFTYVREYNKGTTVADTKTAHSGAVILNALTTTPTDDESGTFTITLRVINPEENVKSLANNLQITANLFKYDESILDETVNDDTQKIKYTLNSTKDAYSVGKNGSPTGEITIEPFINGLPVTYTSTSTSGFASSSITTINLPNTITSISNYSFYSSSLENIIIPNSVTNISSNAFESCRLLSNVVISNNVTSLKGNSFAGCESLTSIIIPNSVTNVSYVFNGCINLTNITFEQEDYTKMTFGTDVFNNCSNLTKIYVPDTAVEGYKGLENLSTYADKIDSVKNKPAA